MSLTCMSRYIGRTPPFSAISGRGIVSLLNPSSWYDDGTLTTMALSAPEGWTKPLRAVEDREMLLTDGVRRKALCESLCSMVVNQCQRKKSYQITRISQTTQK